MSNLIPEQRMDRNGKLVTKHVRATPKQGTGRTAMPQPSLGTAATEPSSKKPFKPRKSQTLQLTQSHDVAFYPLDTRLVSDDERRKKAEREASSRYHSTYYYFKASEAEIYDVLSVAPDAEALRMLSHDVRTADEARAYLTEHGASDLIIDRRDTMNEALEKNVSHYDFLKSYREMKDEYKSSEHLVDIVRFFSSSLSDGTNGVAMEDIATGKISFDDIKAVGITKLKPYSRLSSLLGTFADLKKGEGDYTIDGIKALIQKASDNGLEYRDFSYVCRTMKEIGLEEVMSFKNLGAVASAFHAYKLAPGSNKYEDDAIQRAVYAARIFEGMEERVRPVYFSDGFYEAGIPADKAIDVISRGGGVREAIAIHEEGIESSVSGGWL